MTREQRQLYLIGELFSEDPRYKNMAIPEKLEEQKRLLRSLMNVPRAKKINSVFLEIQNEYVPTPMHAFIPSCQKYNFPDGDYEARQRRLCAGFRFCPAPDFFLHLQCRSLLSTS